MINIKIYNIFSVAFLFAMVLVISILCFVLSALLIEIKFSERLSMNQLFYCVAPTATPLTDDLDNIYRDLDTGA